MPTVEKAGASGPGVLFKAVSGVLLSQGACQCQWCGLAECGSWWGLGLDLGGVGFHPSAALMLWLCPYY